MKLIQSFINTILLLLFTFSAGSVIATDDISSETSRILKPGQSAPISSLFNLEEKSVRFPAKEQWSLVLFWSLFCHSCLEEIPVILQEISEMQNISVETYLVSIDTARMKKGIQNYLRKRALKADVLLDEIASQSYIAADLWGVKTTPSVFLISPSGEIVFSHEGPFDTNLLWKVLTENSQKKPACKETGNLCKD
ncbi:MAG: TlpA family protein disulfide reductase [Candidatus Riflebacteria bacterium]|nr:TlpA family protein disulfide reductase [Candidatus Riflebacteria bacterium]